MPTIQFYKTEVKHRETELKIVKTYEYLGSIITDVEKIEIKFANILKSQKNCTIHIKKSTRINIIDKKKLQWKCIMKWLYRFYNYMPVKVGASKRSIMV